MIMTKDELLAEAQLVIADLIAALLHRYGNLPGGFEADPSVKRARKLLADIDGAMDP